MRKKLITTFLLICLWQVASLLINKEVILPLPIHVFFRMIELAVHRSFYIAIFSTLGRIALSFIIAMIIGTLLGILSGLYKSLREFLYPMITLLQTIPQIGYILVLIVWFDSFTALIIIILLMILPVFYNNAVNGILNIDQELQDVICLYHHGFFYNLTKVYIPLIQGYMISAIETCLPLSFKVGVMAEIFASSSQGIGKQLYYARVQIDMVSIFAWIIWMVIMSVCITNLIKRLLNKIKSY